jgi:hypothetical protein
MMPFYCRLKKDKSYTGTCISEHVSPIPREIQNEKGEIVTTIVMEALLSVLWDNQRSPAPCYHNPSEIEWLEIPQLTAVESEIETNEAANDEENDEEDDDEEAEEAEIVNEKL